MDTLSPTLHTVGVSEAAAALRLLLVEDDAELRHHLSDYLHLQGFETVGVDGLSDARARLGQLRFDAVLVDLQLGSENGLDLVKELAVDRGPAVLIVTARGDEADRVVGLEVGADDYLVKPFSFRELTARIRTVLRRVAPARTAVRQRRLAYFDRWSVDLAGFKGRPANGDHDVEFTAGELAVLRAFLDHPGRVLWRNELLALTHDGDTQVFPRTIDVLVARLRQKLEQEPRRPAIIRTVRGEGYRFEPDVRWEVH